MKKKFAIYDRTLRNDADMQAFRVPDIERHVNSLGGLVLKVFTDLNHDGASARDGFSDFYSFLAAGKVDAVAIYSLQRLSTSGGTCIKDLLTIHELDLMLVTVRENINTAFSQQAFLWPVLRSLRSMNKEARRKAVKRGQKEAQEAGKHIGRPGIPFEDLQMAVRYIREIETDPVEAYQPWQIQKKCNISSAMYYYIRDAMEAYHPEATAEEIAQASKLGVSTAERIITIMEAGEYRTLNKEH